MIPSRVRAVLVAVAVVVVLGALVLFRPSSSLTRSDLAIELGGAYPAAAIATGERVEVELVASVADVEVVAGRPTAVWAYNGSVPGPEIRVPLGATVVADFRNDLPQASTIHWHGVRVPNGMDGVPDVTQAPIDPGDFFRYEFTPPDAGTFWYHSHVNGSEQVDRGLYGALIVEDPDAPPYSRDVVWVVDDWLFDGDGQLVEDFDDRHAAQHNGRWGDVITVNGAVDAVFTAAPGERLRVRLVNASNGRPYALDFGGLDARRVAVDGMLARDPEPADGFVLAPGNRVDVDLVVPADVGEYVIRNTFFGEAMSIATLVVAGEPVATPSFTPPANPLVPEWSSVDVPVDREYVLEYVVPDGAEDAEPGGELSLAGEEPLGDWAMNGYRFGEPEPLVLSTGEFARLRITNPSEAMHPIHLHGQFFKLLAVDGDAMDEGHFRDTVLVDSGQTVDIGLVAFDPGSWAFHCHIQEHAASGMFTTIEVRAA